MTLGELFELLVNHPIIIVFYFIAVPMTAFLAGILDRNEGHKPPWKYLYSTLIYIICIPGIFSVLLNIWLFFFRGMNPMDSNIYVQILPIASMLATLWLIRLVVDFNDLPGFDKIWGLLLESTILLIALWIVDRSGIWRITEWPAGWALLLFIIMLALLGWGKRRAWKG